MADTDNIIAFQGAHGAYSDLACRDVFPELVTLPCRTFEDAFAAIRDGKAGRGMIPIENSIAGRVADIHHLLPDSGLHIIGEHFQRVNHHLMAVKGASLDKITHVHSHVHALGQCRQFLRRNKLEAVVHADTAGASADIAARGDATEAAIAEHKRAHASEIAHFAARAREEAAAAAAAAGEDAGMEDAGARDGGYAPEAAGAAATVAPVPVPTSAVRRGLENTSLGFDENTEEGKRARAEAIARACGFDGKAVAKERCLREAFATIWV